MNVSGTWKKGKELRGHPEERAVRGRLQEEAVMQLGAVFAGWCALLSSLTAGSGLLHQFSSPRPPPEQRLLGELGLTTAARPRARSLGGRRAPGSTAGDVCVCPPVLGTFAVLSLMTGSAVERLVPEPLGGNLSGIEREQLDAQRVGVAAALAFGSGALMVREDPGGIHAGAPGELGQVRGRDECPARV